MRLGLYVEAYVLIILVTLRLRASGGRSVFHAAPHPERPTRRYSAAEEERIIEAARRALHLAECTIPIRLSCLQRALVLQQLLGRRGIASRLRIGVRLRGARLDAHAWLEHRGRVLHGSPDHPSQYQPLQATSDTVPFP